MDLHIFKTSMHEFIIVPVLLNRNVHSAVSRNQVEIEVEADQVSEIYDLSTCNDQSLQVERSCMSLRMTKR